MLEIPESHTLAYQLNQTVCEKRIQSVVANASPHGFAFYQGDPAGYHDLLSGKKVDCAHALGGWVEIAAENARILVGDGVNMRFYAPGEPRPPKHQLLVEFEDFSALVCTLQMYGGMWAYLEGENDNYYYRIAKEKPSPLTSEFNEEHFASICREAKPSLSAKALLATEQRIPGLGNGCLQDILFRSGIHPKSKISALSSTELDTLYATIRETLWDMTVQGGRNTEKDLFGCSGGYATILSSKTWKNPCPSCSGEIQRQAFLGGSVYFCPACQPLK